jgi:hypothetical protein
VKEEAPAIPENNGNVLNFGDVQNQTQNVSTDIQQMIVQMDGLQIGNMVEFQQTMEQQQAQVGGIVVGGIIDMNGMGGMPAGVVSLPVQQPVNVNLGEIGTSSVIPQDQYETPGQSTPETTIMPSANENRKMIINQGSVDKLER